MKLNVPLIQQKKGNECQVATLLMVLRYFGEDIEYDELLKQLKPYLSEKGMHSQGASMYICKRGYKTYFAHHDLGVLSPEIENINENDLDLLRKELEKIPDQEKYQYRRTKLKLDVKYIKLGGMYSTILPTLELIDDYLGKGIPVVLSAVRNKGIHLNPVGGQGNHSIMVIGKENDFYHINDPSPHSEGQYLLHKDRLLHAWYNSGVQIRVSWK